MKSANFYVKSNYIKNTQKSWVLCEGKLLYHQNITFLNIKSIPSKTDKNWDSRSNKSGLSTISQYQRSINHFPLNVLLNLWEFRSCEIKSVNFDGISKFAIKLIPSGFFSSKKLYLLPENEDSLTEWCGLISGFITHSFTAIESNYNTQSRSSMGTLASDQVSVASTLTRNCDIYVGLDENDAYEQGNQNEFHLVTIEPTEHSNLLGLSGNYLIRLSNEALELLKLPSRDVVHTFPYASIRRFGSKANLFRIEAGRRCSTGIGSFIFSTKDSDHIASRIKENARLLKNQQYDQTSGGSSRSLNQLSEHQLNLIEAHHPQSLQRGYHGGSSISQSYNTHVNKSSTLTATSSNTSIASDKTMQRDYSQIDKHSNSGELPKPPKVDDESNQDDTLENAAEDNVESDKCKVDVQQQLNTTQVETDVKQEHPLDDNESDNIFLKMLNVKTNEIRPTSLVSNSSVNELPPPPLPPVIIQSPPSTPEQPPPPQYKVTQSSFFKYRHHNNEQAQQQPTNFRNAKTLLANTNVTINSCPVSPKSSSSSNTSSTRKKSPPPVSPKPKFHSLTNSPQTCQLLTQDSVAAGNTNDKLLSNKDNLPIKNENGFREFDDMIKQLELSFI